MFGSGLSFEDFLRDYWQKKPYLFRQAIPEIISPLSADELAGLACVDGIHSRLIFESAKYSPESRAWSVRNGPFDDKDFANLPETGWSLLVSDIEKHVPDARDLIDQFRFIPDWRIDDLMISYAPTGSSVGAHVDAYDVFLLQLQGTRRWHISENFDTQCLDNTDIRVLAQFEAEQSWDLLPGDMLYLPPNVAHHGIAQNECMTASIGFRAPELRSLISDFGEFLARQLSEDARYSDPELVPQNHPAEISAHTIHKLKTLLRDSINTDDNTVRRWIGEYVSDTRSGSQLYENDSSFDSYHDLARELKRIESIEHNPMSRFVFSHGESNTLLFVDGNCYPCSSQLAETLCQQHMLQCETLLINIQDEDDETVILDLFNKHCLLLEQ